MPRRLKQWAVLGSLGVLSLGAPALALPAAGEPVPSFTAKDLLGHSHESQEWQGQRTLLVIITEQHAGDEMQRWFDAANPKLDESVHRASIISLSLPFYVSSGMMRGRAKGQVPQEFWTDTWADKDAKLAQVLGLATSRQPYVLALDEHGQVLASIHGTVDSADAHLILDALAGQPRPK